MKIEYFPDTDTLYIDIKDTPSVDSREIKSGVILDFDQDGNLTGIEIDHAKKVANLSRVETKSLPLKDIVFS